MRSHHRTPMEAFCGIYCCQFGTPNVTQEQAVTAMAGRVVGGLLMMYAVLYLAQFLFNTLYDNPQLVWDVMNYVSALAILIALAANFAHMSSQSGGGEPLNLARLCAHTLFYANAVLAIWYFRNWIYLLALEEGESASIPIDVIWDFVAVMIPLVLAATGRRLWQKGV